MSITSKLKRGLEKASEWGSDDPSLPKNPLTNYPKQEPDNISAVRMERALEKFTKKVGGEEKKTPFAGTGMMPPPSDYAKMQMPPNMHKTKYGRPVQPLRTPKLHSFKPKKMKWHTSKPARRPTTYLVYQQINKNESQLIGQTNSYEEAQLAIQTYPYCYVVEEKKSLTFKPKLVR